MVCAVVCVAPDTMLRLLRLLTKRSVALEHFDLSPTGKEADGADGWHILYGYYYETYEKRDGRWMFTERRWQRHLGVNSGGLVFPTEPLKGSDAFEGRWP